MEGMVYNIDKNKVFYSIVKEPSSEIGELFDNVFYGAFNSAYEDSAVTAALVLLGIIPHANAPITEAQLRSHGIKIQVSYPLHVKYRIQ